MKMLPATPYGTHSKAEKLVFDKLRAISLHEDMLALHSINLTRHAYKRFGEIDFVICGPLGLFVIEVKGGRVACRNGVWQYTNRYDESSESIEGPFKQAETALHGLMDNLRNNFSASVIAQFVVGYGVILPECVLSAQGAEWEPLVLADASQFRDFEGWLTQLFRYWKNKAGTENPSSSENLKRLQNYLRPEFEALIPLYVQTRETEGRVVKLTADQLVLVDVVAANPRVWCAGGAGTGKTFLAMELARCWTARGLKVVLVCHSPWLRRWLEARFSLPGLTVTLAGSIRTACRRNGIESFDALIVDEGQDLLDMETLDNLDATLNHGLSHGRWCFFHDINNQAGLWSPPDQAALDYLLSFQPVRAPLLTNCRNTMVILEKVQATLGADMGTRGTGAGPRIREQIVSSGEPYITMLTKEIHEIVDHGGIAPGNLTILSPLPFAHSSLAQLPESMRCKITVLDEYCLRHFPPNEINFAEIVNFKGLENEAIIIIDLEPPDKLGDQLVLHYVAMTRARAVLSLIYRVNV